MDLTKVYVRIKCKQQALTVERLFQRAGYNWRICSLLKDGRTSYVRDHYEKHLLGFGMHAQDSLFWDRLEYLSNDKQEISLRELKQYVEKNY